MSTPEAPAVLNRRWILTECDSDAARALAREAGLPLLIAELLVARGVRTAAEAERFLHPQFEHLHDPYSMLGMERAVERIRQAIGACETILIYGDYDVDGTTAVVLLKTAIEMLGGVTCFHVPHRIREGYGMQGEVLESFARDGARLVISVDTGIRAFAAAEAAEILGLDLIVTDHHLPEAGSALPKALAILNPNQAACGYPCKHLCGAGVVFKLAQALLEGWDRERARTKILPSFLKMVAIATVADAVPLLGENRVITAIGLEQLQRPVHPGLRSLMEVAQLDPSRRKLNPVDVAFRIAPRINAAGRMDVATDVIELFTTKDAKRAHEIAGRLDRLNQERRDAEATMLKEIVERLEEEHFREARCIVMDGDGWHRGVIGILASRIVDRTGKPAIVIAHDGENGSRTARGTAHGSGRSIHGFHLLEAIETCRDLFSRFGGHAHAVGFSLPSDRVEELRTRLCGYAAERLSEEDLGSPLECDAVLPLDRVTPAVFSWLKRLEPMGMGNSEPVFLAQNVRIASAPRYMKEKHVRLQVAQGPHRGNIAALGWHWAERVQQMQLEEGSVIHLAYKLRENEHPEFGGLELEIAGIFPAD
ncbi:MAG: single-stranded-DNA-specific exonuclease RecJ [Silvibacterium sp.]|nr:single-stranded-DNA-specific exonuclease RecJ [Silvibacterium sp.]